MRVARHSQAALPSRPCARRRRRPVRLPIQLPCLPAPPPSPAPRPAGPQTPWTGACPPWGASTRTWRRGWWTQAPARRCRTARWGSCRCGGLPRLRRHWLHCPLPPCCLLMLSSAALAGRLRLRRAARAAGHAKIWGRAWLDGWCLGSATPPCMCVLPAPAGWTCLEDTHQPSLCPARAAGAGILCDAGILGRRRQHRSGNRPGAAQRVGGGGLCVCVCVCHDSVVSATVAVTAAAVAHLRAAACGGRRCRWHRAARPPRPSPLVLHLKPPPVPVRAPVHLCVLCVGAGGLDADGRPGHHRCPGLLQHRGAHQRHDPAWRREHLPSVRLPAPPCWAGLSWRWQSLLGGGRGGLRAGWRRLAARRQAGGRALALQALEQGQRHGAGVWSGRAPPARRPVQRCRLIPTTHTPARLLPATHAAACSEVEEFLHTHPAVADVQVFGVPSRLYGEQVCAWVKLR